MAKWSVNKKETPQKGFSSQPQGDKQPFNQTWWLAKRFNCPTHLTLKSNVIYSANIERLKLIDEQRAKTGKELVDLALK